MRTYIESEDVPRKRDKEVSKQKLIEAGVEVFALRGYDAATTKEVALKAGVSEGLIHRYFQSKAGLLIAIIKSFHEEEAKCSLPVAKAGCDLETEIRALLENDIDHAKENKDFMRVAVSRSIVDPAIAKEISSDLFESKVPELALRLKDHVKQGHMKPQKDYEGVALSLLAMGFSIGFHGHVLFGIPEERSRELCRIFAKILAKGLSQEAK